MYNFKNWLYKYNSDTFFKDFINNKYKNLKIKKNKKNINNNLYLKTKLENIKKECQEKNLNCDTNFILDDLLKLTNLTENEITINNYLIKFFKQNIKINLNIYIIYSKYSVKYKQYLSKNNKTIKIDKLLLNNINDIQKINIKNNTDIIFIHYREAYGKNYILNRFKQNLKIFNKVLNNTLVNIIVITINLSIPNLIRDFLVLLNNYCTIYFLLDYRYTEVQWLNVKLVCSNFTKIDELKEKIKEIIDLDIQSNEEGFLEEDVSKYEIIKYYDNMTEFIYNRYINFYKIFKGRELVEEEKDMIIKYNLKGILQQGIKISSFKINWMTQNMNKNIIKVKNNDLILYDNVSFPEGKCIINIMKNMNCCNNMLEIGMGYGISTLFLTSGLKYLDKVKNKSKGRLYSIELELFTKYGAIGMLYLHRNQLLKYHKLLEYSVEEGLKILFKKNVILDLILINENNLVNEKNIKLFIKLLKNNGLIIFDDGLLLNTIKLINYLKNNYNIENIKCYKNMKGFKILK